ncbi:MAG: universal stress protein [Thermoplasmata archaeon]|nr:universal stress protein [Thermoplasmata archaeon]
MYRHILIPVNAPAEVEPMIRFASQLLEADGEVRILHIIPTTTLPEVTRQWRDSVNIVVPAHEAGAALDVRVDPEVRASTDVVGEILESAETHGVEAIFMTLAGDRRSRNPFVGHTASALLHHAPCDVIVVNRLALAEERVQRILVPAFGDSAPPKAMRIAEEIAVRHHGIPIVSLHLGPRHPGDAPPPARSPRGVPLHHHPVLGSGIFGHGRRRLADVILHEAADERYGLLLVGEEAPPGDGPSPPEGARITRRFLEELFRGAPCPVIAVRG